MIDRDAAADELGDLADAGELLADLDALVEAGLLEGFPGLSGTRFAVRAHHAGDDGADPPDDEHQLD